MIRSFPYFSDNQIANDPVAASYKTQAGVTFDAAHREYDANYHIYNDISVNSKPDDIVAALIPRTRS